MVGRVRNFLQDDVLLMHSMAWLENEPTENLTAEERDARNRWRNPQKRAMLSRYAVGTVDQVMLSVLKVRYGVLRLLGLTDKVVIIDEIHAYDAYMTEIIKRLVEWLNELRIPVVMLSATLPSERKKTLLGVMECSIVLSSTHALLLERLNGKYGNVSVRFIKSRQKQRLF